MARRPPTLTLPRKGGGRTRLTPELVAHLPRPGMVAPGAIAYAPGGRFITYLFSERGDLVRDLWRLDLQSGRREKWLSPPGEGITEANVSRDEALRRERQRILSTGITHYAWAEDAEVLLLPIRNVVYRWRGGELEQADERHIPVYPIVHQATNTPQIEEHRYPFAGEPNARVGLGVVPAAGGPATWLDLGPAEDIYLARVDWHPDGRLFVQVLSRDQRRLVLKAFDPGRWTPQTLLAEESDTWVNVHNDLRFLKETGEFTWSSERTGYRHLYLYQPDGTLLRQLTHGEWPVDGIRGLDSKGRQLVFAAWTDTPVERHLYRAPLDGGDPTRITQAAGTHDGVASPDGSSFIDLFDSRTQPPSCVVRNADGTTLWTLHEAASIELDLPPPELHSFRASDGARLHAAVYRPAAAQPAPVLVAVYGGPHLQTVTDSWGLAVDLRAQLLAAEGFAVVKIDNRGSDRRGVAFESAIKGNFGDLEVRDQAEGVRWLASLGIGDLTRVGIYGWSYGGYMTAMGLVKAPDLFRVGVSGAPVTSWDGYDTAYTERYMGTPASNPEGYRQSSVLTHGDRLRGKLLLIHGLLDENVHFRHTARLMQALIDAGKPFDVLLYPNERHAPRSEKDRVAMEKRILEYFQQHL